jgi:hypothetical protein
MFLIDRGTDIVIVMSTLPHPLARQSLKDNLPAIRRQIINPGFDGGKHLHVEWVLMVEEGGVDKTSQDGGDRSVGVDGGIGPRVDYLRDGKVDDDFGEAPCRVIQVATLISTIDRRANLKWSFESMEWVGSEEVGSVQTRYCASSSMTKWPPSATCCAMNSIMGAIKGFRQ